MRVKVREMGSVGPRLDFFLWLCNYSCKDLQLARSQAPRSLEQRSFSPKRHSVDDKSAAFTM